MAQELAQDFKEFLNLLRANQVEYLLIGASDWIAATKEKQESERPT